MKFQQITEGLGQDADVMEQDHEVQMARADCFHAAKNAIELHRMLRNISERQGLEGWVSEKITLAADYLSTVKEYLEYEMMGKPDEFDIGPKAEYDQMFGQYMGESLEPKKIIKENDQLNAERKISTPGLNARARELLIKAYGQFPQSENDVSALVNYLSYLESRTGRDVNRLDSENREQDTEINKLDKMSDKEASMINKLEQEVIALKDQLAILTKRKMGESKQNKNRIAEMTAGGTGAGSVAAVVAPLGANTKKKKKNSTVNEGFPILAPALAPAAVGVGAIGARVAPALMRAAPMAASALLGREEETKASTMSDAKKERIARAATRYDSQIAELERQLAASEKSKR